VSLAKEEVKEKEVISKKVVKKEVKLDLKSNANKEI